MSDVSLALSDAAAVAPQAFERVYSVYHDRIFRFCVSQLGNPSVAEDICADVFAKACAAYPRKPPEPDRIAPWLFRIARNAIIDERRRRARWGTLLTSIFAAPRHEVMPMISR